MTSSKFGRINRRRMVVSSAILGGAAILPSGHSLQASATTRNEGILPTDKDISGVNGFGGDSSRINDMRGTESNTPYEMEIKWSFALENYSAVDTILALAGDILYFASNDDVVFAVDARTGIELWRFTTQGKATNLNVVDGVVFFGSQEDHYYAVDAVEGTVIWRLENPGTSLSPEVADGIVYVAKDWNLYALDGTTGNERWRFAIPNGMTSPVVADGVVYMGLDESDCTICAVGADDGTELWRFTPDYDDYGWAHPHIVDGIVYIRPRETLYAVDATNGRELWRLGLATVFSDNWFGSIQDFDVRNGVVYALGDTYETSVGAFDTISGDELWRSVIPDNSGFIVSISDEAVYVTDSENLIALDTASGSLLWSTQIVDFNLCCSPQVVEYDGQFCIVYQGSVFSLDKTTQQEIWRYTATDWYTVKWVRLGHGVVYCELYDTAMGNTALNQVVALGPAKPSLKAGEAARVTIVTSLRGGPSPTAVERAELEQDTVVTITGGAETTGDVVWWPVTVDETGDQGWVEASALAPLTSGPEPTETA